MREEQSDGSESAGGVSGVKGRRMLGSGHLGDRVPAGYREGKRGATSHLHGDHRYTRRGGSGEAVSWQGRNPGYSRTVIWITVILLTVATFISLRGR